MGNFKFIGALPRKSAIFIVVFFVALFFVPKLALANACTSNGTGNWNAAGTWTSCGSTTPRGADSVTIANGHTVTLNTDNVVAASLTVNNGGSFSQGSNNLTVTGNFTIGGGTSGIYTAGSGTLTIGGNVTINAGATYTKGSGIVTFNKGGTQTWTDNTSGQDLGTVQISKPTFALIANTAKGSTDNNSVTTDAIDTTGADLIVAGVAYANGVGYTLADSQSNSWTSLTSYNDGGGMNIQLYYKQSPTTSTSHTFSITGGTTYPALFIAAFKGSTSTPLDTETGSGGQSTTRQPGSLTPAQTNELLITALGFNRNNTLSVNSSFTISNQMVVVSNQHWGGGLAYKIKTDGTAENPTWSWDGTNDYNAAAQAAFKRSTNNTTLNLASSVKATSLTIDASQTFSHNGSNTLILTGTSTPLIINGTFTISSGTVDYTGNGATITNTTYNNLGLKPSSSSQQVIPSGTLTVNGTLTIGDGTNTGAIASGNPTINLIGDLTIAANATYTKGSGTTTFKAGTTQTWTDNTSGQDLGAVTIAVNTTNTNVNLSGTASATSVTINASQTLFANGSNTLILTGTGTPLTVNGTFAPSTGTVQYTGTTATVTSTSFNNLTLGGTGTYTMPANPINIAGNLVVTSGATVTKGAGTVTLKKGGTQTVTDNNGTTQDLGTVVVSTGVGAGYSYYRSITIDRTKVPNTDQTNFPVLVAGTYNGTGGIADLRTTGNGGKVQSTSGYDIIFTSDSTCTTPLKFERVNWAAATGIVEFWVKIGTVATGSDTVFYLCYGNSAVAVDQQDATSVWDSNYKGVWHLPNGTSLTAVDTTSNPNDGTITEATAVAGKVDGAASFDGSNDKIQVGSNSSLSVTNMTMEAWVYIPTSVPAGYKAIIEHNRSGNGWFTIFKSGATNGFHWRIRGTVLDDPTTTIVANTWYHVVGTVSGTTLVGYVNGSAVGSPTTVTALSAVDDIVTFGLNNAAGEGFPGYIDEIRISGSARTADWITTEYNNHNIPDKSAGAGGFYTVGSETNSATTVNLGGSARVSSLTVDASQIFSTNGANTLTLTGSTTPLTATGTFTAGATSTVNYIGSSATNVTAGTYGNLGVGTTSDEGTAVTYTLAGDTTVAGTLTIGNASSTNSDVLDASSRTVTLSSTGTPLSITSKGTFTASTSTVQYTGTTATVTATTFNNLTLGGTGTYTMPASTINITGNLVITSGATVTKGAGTVVFKKGGTQTWTDSNGTAQDLGAVQVSVNVTNTTLNLASSVKATSLTIDDSQIFSHNGSNTLVLTGTGTPLTATGTFTASTGTLQYTGTTATVTATTFNNLTLGGTGTYTMPASTTTLRGNLAITSGATVTKGAGTVVFAKGGTQTWTDNNGTSQDLGAVQVSDNAGASTLNLASSVKATSLTIDASQIFSHNGSNTLTLTGNGASVLANSGTFTASTGIVEFASAATTGTTVPTLTYYTLTLNKGSNTFTSASGTLTIGGNLNVTAGSLDLTANDPTSTVTGNITIDGTLLASNSANLTFSGNFTNNGTFTHNSGTVVAAPTSTSNITTGGASTLTFQNFTSTTAGKTLQFEASDETRFNGTLTLTGASGNPIWIQSTSAGSQWLMNLQGSAAVTFINVKDGGCAGGTNVISPNGTVLNQGNNNATCWVFITYGGGTNTDATGGGSGGGTPVGGGGQSGGGGETPTESGSGGGTPQGGGGQGGGGGTP